MQHEQIGQKKGFIIGSKAGGKSTLVQSLNYEIEINLVKEEACRDKVFSSHRRKTHKRVSEFFKEPKKQNKELFSF